MSYEAYYKCKEHDVVFSELNEEMNDAHEGCEQVEVYQCDRCGDFFEKVKDDLCYLHFQEREEEWKAVADTQSALQSFR